MIAIKNHLYQVTLIDIHLLLYGQYYVIITTTANIVYHITDHHSVSSYLYNEI